MNYKRAIEIFEKVKRNYDIPEDAELDFVEKRYIEIVEEITELSKITTKNELVWVGQYIVDQRFYEIACDMSGKIIRVEKGR
jgi:hypothetical protein